MATDLAVLGRDPLFGGGGAAQTEAFLRGATALGRRPELWYDPHPGLRGPRLTWRRVEALRELAWARRPLPASRSLWVVSTHASDGAAAPGSGRPYDAWIGTTVATEHAGRAGALHPAHRAAAAISLPTLRRIEREVLAKARRLYATSAASRADLATTAHRDDVRILPIPVDVDRFAPAERWPPERPNVLFVGRSDDPRKNVRLLIDAARLVDGDISLTLVGKPPRGPVPPNVRVLGGVADVAVALRDATLFVLPSRQEGFGIVAAEALASGVPVVTTPSGGPEELVRESGGGVVLDGFSPEELAGTITGLIGDTTRLEGMRAAGRAYVEREHSRERFEALLAEALA